MNTVLYILVFVVILLLCIIIGITDNKLDKIWSTILIFGIIFSGGYTIKQDSQKLGEKQGKKEAYTNILKGKENPYKMVFKKEYLNESDTIIVKNIDTIYVKKNKKN